MADDLINCIVMRFINILLLHIHNALEPKCRHVLGPAIVQYLPVGPEKYL